MKVLVSGVVHRKGTAKDTGNEYDFTVVKTLRPVEELDTNRMTVRGCGLVEVEVKAEPSIIPALRPFQGKFPLELDLETDARPNRFNGLDLVVVGVKGGK